MGERTYFPTMANQEDIKSRIGTSGDGATDNPTTLFGGVKGILNKFTSIWTAVRAAKLDNIQTVLNTPDGNTLAAWISAIDTKALNAYNKAEAARVSADNAANQAYAALVAVQNAANSIAQIKNATDGHYICSGNARYTVLNREITYTSAERPNNGAYKSLGCFTPKKDGIVRVHIRHRNAIANTGSGYRLGYIAMGTGVGIFDNHVVTGMGINAITNKNAPGRDKSAPVGTLVFMPIGIYSLAQGGNHTNWIDAYADILVRKNVDIPFAIDVSTGNYGGAVNLIEIMYDEE